ncbi:hypothetical protein AKJ64_03065 [candidate division MSBL1 archaeon SCGC-AAA259E17]|uniref:Uncharacterized protein n=1 Tax=candidate division MSBL1 archaeon SCGC-AAA259E17 TaxID=1698263 RepID=A0A133UE43_9EURY|nr:hypothetical protein AKJ64_03065 [candidate division MSBL1 archaeon SCGC-AAA259E17]
MSMVTFGEDMMAVLIATGLVLVFVTILGDSFSAHREKEDSVEKFQLFLTISDFLRGGSFSGEDGGFEPGVLSREVLEEKLPQFLERLRRQCIRLRVEVVSLGGELIFSSEADKENFSRSLSVPVVYECKGKKIPAKMVVWIGEDCI